MSKNKTFDPFGWEKPNRKDDQLYVQVKVNDDEIVTSVSEKTNEPFVSGYKAPEKTRKDKSEQCPGARETHEYPSLEFAEKIISKSARDSWLENNHPEDKVDSGLFKMVKDGYVNLAGKPVEVDIDLSDLEEESLGAGFQSLFPDDSDSWLEDDKFRLVLDVDRVMPEDCESLKGLAEIVKKGSVRGCKSCHGIYSASMNVSLDTAERVSRHFGFADMQVYGTCPQCEANSYLRRK